MSHVRIEVTPGKHWTDAYHVYIDGEEIKNVTYTGKYDGDFDETELRADGMITYICEFDAEVEVTENREIYFRKGKDGLANRL